MSKSKEGTPVIGITIGDINGIGPEVIIKTLRDSRIMNYMTPVIYGSTKTLNYYRKNFHIDDFQYTQLKSQSELLHNKVNVINCWDEMLEITSGKGGGPRSPGRLSRRVQDVVHARPSHLSARPACSCANSLNICPYRVR